MGVETGECVLMPAQGQEWGWVGAPAPPWQLVASSWELPRERNAYWERSEPGGKHWGYHRHHRETQVCGLTKLSDLSIT